MWIGLHDARQLNLHNILVEADSICSMQWALRLWKVPRALVDVVEEVIDIGSALEATFFHVKRSTNGVENHLAKKGVHHHNLIGKSKGRSTFYCQGFLFRLSSRS